MTKVHELSGSVIKKANAFFYEINMEVKTSLRYRFSFVSDLVFFAIFMAVLISGNVGMSFGVEYDYENYKVLMLIGYMAWTVSVEAMSSSTNKVSAELTRGTFYRKLNSVCSIQLLLLANMISSLLAEIIVFVGLLLLAGFLWQIVIPFHLSILLAFTFCTLGMYGLGLLLSGMAIHLKRIGSVMLLVQTGLLFITDTIPTSEAITNITKLIPLTCCNRVIRLCLSEKSYFMEFMWLIVISVLWFAIGNLFFKVFVARAKKRGNLLHY